MQFITYSDGRKVGKAPADTHLVHVIAGDDRAVGVADPNKTRETLPAVAPAVKVYARWLSAARKPAVDLDADPSQEAAHGFTNIEPDQGTDANAQSLNFPLAVRLNALAAQLGVRSQSITQYGAEDGSFHARTGDGIEDQSTKWSCFNPLVESDASTATKAPFTVQYEALSGFETLVERSVKPSFAEQTTANPTYRFFHAPLVLCAGLGDMRASMNGDGTGGLATNAASRCGPNVLAFLDAYKHATGLRELATVVVLPPFVKDSVYSYAAETRESITRTLANRSDVFLVDPDAFEPDETGRFLSANGELALASQIAQASSRMYAVEWPAE